MGMGNQQPAPQPSMRPTMRTYAQNMGAVPPHVMGVAQAPAGVRAQPYAPMAPRPSGGPNSMLARALAARGGQPY